MFCPLCKAEYREGFYRCADCDVDLVNFLEEPPREDVKVARDEPLKLLWRGQDPVVLTVILNALHEEQIPCHDLAIQDTEGLSSSPFRVGRATPGLEIRVFRSDLERAQRVLEAVLEPLLAGSDSIAAPDGTSGRVDTSEEESLGDFNPEGAVAKVWSGQDEAMAQFLADTLRENGIPSRTESHPSGPYLIFVGPRDEARAREIVREVIEGTAPA